jgi:hypothetical protein
MAIFIAAAVITSNPIDVKVNELTLFRNGSEFMYLANYNKIFCRISPSRNFGHGVFGILTVSYVFKDTIT